MKLYVADTHALYRHLTGSDKLGPGAARAFLEAERGEVRILLPAIVLAELFWILGKQGQAAAFAEVLDALATAQQFLLVDLQCGDLADLAVDASVPELHDRLILGVARRRSATPLTRDRELSAVSAVSVEW